MNNDNDLKFACWLHHCPHVSSSFSGDATLRLLRHNNVLAELILVLLTQISHFIEFCFVIYLNHVQALSIVCKQKKFKIEYSVKENLLICTLSNLHLRA